MPDLYETMSTLRAVRRLRPDPIPADVLDRVLQAACWAPTGGNRQPWRIVLVTDPVQKQAVADIYRPLWARYAAQNREMLAGAGLTDDRLAPIERTFAAGDHLAEHMAEAPALAVFCHDPSNIMWTDARLDRTPLVGGGSVYPAVQNFMLACAAEGVGCSLTTLHCQREDELKAVLGIPDEWGTAALVPIGYPMAGGHGPISRRGPDRLVYRDTFGTPFSPA